MKISAYIITFNEEKHIRECLNSLHFCDEIVIFDSYSTDNTLSIVEKFSRKKKDIRIKIRKGSFKGFVDQKNLAIKYTSNDWVLNLDADERISDELARSLVNLKLNPPSQNISAFSMNRRNFYIDSWINYSGWYPDKKIRLMNKMFGKWKGDNVHETCQISSGKVIHLKGDILHYTFESISNHLSKIDRYTTIAAEDYFKRGKKASPFSAILRMISTFFRSYFFKLGILDGKAGFVLAVMSSYHTFLKYTKLYYLNKKAG